MIEQQQNVKQEHKFKIVKYMQKKKMYVKNVMIILY